jgi:hypothetical protein
LFLKSSRRETAADPFWPPSGASYDHYKFQAVVARTVHARPAREMASGDHAGPWTRLPIRNERKPLAEIVLCNLFILLGTVRSDNNSNSEGVHHLNFVEALAPTLVWFDFLHG